MYKLNYLVQEIPYSVHITLRKKFVNDSGKNANPTDDEEVKTNVENTSTREKEKLINLGKENKELSDRIKDNLQTIEMFRVENEEVENKNGDLEGEKIKLEDKNCIEKFLTPNILL